VPEFRSLVPSGRLEDVFAMLSQGDVQ